jgi:hypothetical protein
MKCTGLREGILERRGRPLVIRHSAGLNSPNLGDFIDDRGFGDELNNNLFLRAEIGTTEGMRMTRGKGVSRIMDHRISVIATRTKAVHTIARKKETYQR